MCPNVAIIWMPLLRTFSCSNLLSLLIHEVSVYLGFADWKMAELFRNICIHNRDDKKWRQSKNKGVAFPSYYSRKATGGSFLLWDHHKRRISLCPPSFIESELPITPLRDSLGMSKLKWLNKNQSEVQNIIVFCDLNFQEGIFLWRKTTLCKAQPCERGAKAPQTLLLWDGCKEFSCSLKHRKSLAGPEPVWINCFIQRTCKSNAHYDSKDCL